MNLCILIPLLVGLISAILGYLLGRLSSSGGDAITDTTDIDFWRTKNAELESDLAACKAKFSAGAGNIASSSSAKRGAGTTVEAVAFDAGAAKAVFGKKIKEHDLTIVEGIGPKIQELFHTPGVRSWKELSETSVSRCQEILNSAGERYSVHNPGTWPRQAAMAARGEWQALKDWQDILDHGKE